MDGWVTLSQIASPNNVDLSLNADKSKWFLHHITFVSRRKCFYNCFKSIVIWWWRSRYRTVFVCYRCRIVMFWTRNVFFCVFLLPVYVVDLPVYCESIVIWWRRSRRRIGIVWYKCRIVVSWTRIYYMCSSSLFMWLLLASVASPS